jgi:hypothetical protein
LFGHCFLKIFRYFKLPYGFNLISCFLENTAFIVANNIILTAQIGQALSANQFTDWQVVNSAEKATYLANRTNPSYVILDVAMVTGSLGVFCANLIVHEDAGIFLISNQPRTLEITSRIDEARLQCPQILGTFDFPVNVETLIATMSSHRSRMLNTNSSQGSSKTTIGNLFRQTEPEAAVGVADWIKTYPELNSCSYVSSNGQVTHTHGDVQEGQGVAAHYLMMIARGIGNELGLSNLTEIHQHGRDQKFLTVDAGSQFIALSATPKIDLEAIAPKLQTSTL